MPLGSTDSGMPNPQESLNQFMDLRYPEESNGYGSNRGTKDIKYRIESTCYGINEVGKARNAALCVSS